MFSAITIAESPPCLTYRLLVTPSGFRDNPGDIVNRGGFQQVPAGETLALIGGNVSVENGGILFAPGGRIELGGLVQTGTIRIADDGSLSFPDDVVRGDVSVDSSFVAVFSGEGGSIGVNAKNFNLTNGSGFLGGISENQGSVDAKAGDITINVTENFVLNGGLISASSEGEGDAGDITINATESFIATNGSVISSNIGNGEGTSARGKVGIISISSRDISFSEGSQIQAGAFSGAIATQPGTISLTATERIFFTGTNTGIDGSNELGALGDTSNILLFTNDLTLTNGNGIQVTNSNFGEGNVGEIRIDTSNLTLNNGSQIQNAIVGQGNAGNIVINATDTVFLDGQNSNGRRSLIISSSVQEDTVGNGGEIRIDTKNLTLINGAQIGSGIFGEGNGGNIIIKATETISLDGEDENGFSSIISSAVQTGAVGNGGAVRIDTKKLTLTNGAQINSGTFGEGNAGSLTINATDTISLDGEGRDGNNSQIDSSVGQQRIGSAGEVRIDTKNLTITNGAQITSGTFGEGNGNTITINVTDNISLDGTDKDGFGSAIATSVQPEAVGNAGKVNINSKNLFLTNGAFVSSSTLSEGNAGSVTVRVSDSIQLSGVSSNGRGGLFVIALESIGNGGDLNVFTDELIVSNGASISASNFPSIEGLIEPGTGEAGSVRIEANNITLENGRINAATQAGDDGNIILKVTEDIILQDNSLISAEAFQEATGGNIDINANFIIAFPSEADGNDIIASAEQGIGGNINITAEALFGIEEGKATPGNRTNDIDASSEFGLSGEVSIEQPDFDPASGLVELTQEVVDASKLIAQNVCTQTANSEFVDIGKGGLPLNPDDVLAEDTIEVGLVAPVTASSLEIETSKETETVKPRRTRKPPAQGWIWHEDGTVELVAYNPNQIGEQRTWDNHRGCQQ